MVGLKMPAATLSRSIIVRMERKLPGQKPADFMHIDDDGLLALRSQLARFAADNAEKFRNASPAGLEGFTNRLWANWRPLFVVAELCGMGEEVRKAASATVVQADATTMGVVLIGDMIAIMEARGADELRSDDFLEVLHAMEDRRGMNGASRSKSQCRSTSWPPRLSLSRSPLVR